eukprot:Skav232339  [mRNA]  locus=scaffold1704:401439:402953:+ [translate_table: standard]
MDVGWNACCFDSWVDDVGHAWHLDFSDQCLLVRLELGFIASLKRRQCVLMSQQFFGQGLESGLDIVLHKRLLDSVPVQDAALLQTWWQGALQHSLNSRHCVCPSCDVELTLLHMLFECPGCIRECGPVPEAWSACYGLVEQSHFWLRGLVPDGWTRAPAVADEHIVRTGCFENSAGFDFSSLFFGTDGSGGPFSNEPRLRKCAWAVVAVAFENDAFVLVGSITGFVRDGHNPNTVARAELRAFVELLQAIPEGCEPRVAVDASFVINVYHKLRRSPKKIRNPHGDLRGQLATLLDKQVCLNKVKSHITHEEHVSLGRESWSWHANRFADGLASMSATVVAPFAVEDVNAWVFERTKKLTLWMIPRVKYWLSVEAAVPKREPDGPPRTKHELFNQAEAKGIGGHVWKRCPDGLRCNACCSILKTYRSLPDLEVMAALPCSGAGAQVGCGHPLLHKVHFTHTMYGTQPTLQCSQCGGRLAACTKAVSRKLLFPCGTSGARLYRRRG